MGHGSRISSDALPANVRRDSMPESDFNNVNMVPFLSGSRGVPLKTRPDTRHRGC
jgi:hypothetical protein